MKCIMDLECDGLYEDATKIHCAVFKDVETKRVYKFTDTKVMIAFMGKCSVLIGHNIISYDFPVIEKLTGYKYEGKKVDTVLLSRELYKNRPVPDKMKEDYKEAGKKLDGPHSLAAWGYRVGRGKPPVEDWKNQPIGVYLHRCEEDVEINYLAYEEIKKELAKGKFPNRAIWLTMDFMEYISQQERNGWKLDIPRCHRYVKMLTKWIERIDNVLYDELPFLPTVREDTTDDGFKNPFTKAGGIHNNLRKWIDKNGLGDYADYICGPFSRVDFVKVNLGSDSQVKDYLLELGWIPEEYNYSKKEKDEDGNPLQTSPKLSADDAFIGVDGKVGKLICKRFQCVHRRSLIEGWLRRVREDGRIESRISGFTDTYRVRHAGVANVPNASSFFGPQMRMCFIAEEGKVLVSADAASCQDRMIISRARDNGIKDPVFEDMILHGDKAKGTDSHSRARDEINKLFKKMGRAQIQRSSAKNFSYAYKFGGGAKKIGFMAGEKNEKKAIQIGKAVKEAFDTVFQAQIELQQRIKEDEWINTARSKKVKRKYQGREYEKTEFYNGKVTGLDGRQILIRNEKDILVYTVQSDEAITMQRATVMANKILDSKYEQGVQWKQVGFFHDEYTFEVVPEIAEDVKKIIEQCIVDAGNYYHLNLPQIGEGEIGKNWYEIH